MFFRYHLLIVLLSVALHAVDMVVAVAGHQHTHSAAAPCQGGCESHAAHSAHAHSHDHGHIHSCGEPHGHCTAKRAALPESGSAPDHNHGPHHDCTICRHLALTPALVSPPAVAVTPTGSQPVLDSTLLSFPPLRSVEARSRAPPILNA